MTEITRIDSRAYHELREWAFTGHWPPNVSGGVLVKAGDTWVQCSASLEDRVPGFMRHSNSGWLTAEYNMLPHSTGTRKSRDRNKVDGRGKEIERLIGRCLRRAIDLEQIPGQTVHVDCDVLQADGGTRTASITGSILALRQLLDSKIKVEPIVAVSAGLVRGVPMLDLNYHEDSRAGMDMNVAINARTGSILEVQATTEAGSTSQEQFQQVLAMALQGCQQLGQQLNEQTTAHE